MDLWMFCQVLLVAIVSCQTENSTGQFGTQGADYQYVLDSQNTTGEFVNVVNETIVPLTETVTDDGAGMDDGDSGKADDLADYFSKTFGNILTSATNNDDSGETDTLPIDTATNNDDIGETHTFPIDTETNNDDIGETSTFPIDTATNNDDNGETHTFPINTATNNDDNGETDTFPIDTATNNDDNGETHTFPIDTATNNDDIGETSTFPIDTATNNDDNGETHTFPIDTETNNDDIGETSTFPIDTATNNDDNGETHTFPIDTETNNDDIGETSTFPIDTATNNDDNGETHTFPIDTETNNDDIGETSTFPIDTATNNDDNGETHTFPIDTETNNDDIGETSTFPIETDTGDNFTDGVFDDENENAAIPIDTYAQNCSIPAALDMYCEGIPNDVYTYFHYDMSVNGILDSIFDIKVVAALQINCLPGSWCLQDNFHQDIKNGKSGFYLQGPFCSDAMLSCLDNLQSSRTECSEEKLTFLENTILLLCDLEALGYTGQECYTSTLEALYVTYADMTNPGGSRRSFLDVDDCNDFKVQMTKTYLCADGSCNFDQIVLLEKFREWVGIAQTAAYVATTCNISSSCQSNYEDDTTRFPYDYFDDSPTYDNYDDEEYEGEGELEEDGSNDGEGEMDEDKSNDLDDAINEEEAEIEKDDGNERVEDDDSEGHGSNQTGHENEINTESDDGYDTQDKSMMIGLIVMTTSLLLGFLGLAYVVYRRFQRTRNGNYKWGYSQVSTDDASIVQNEYK